MPPFTVYPQIARQRRSLVVIAILFLPLISLAQKNTNPELAASLRPRHKDAKIVSVQSRSDYTFSVRENVVQAALDERLALISLEGGVDYRHPVFYNDNITRGECELRYTSGKSTPFEQRCGNYEVEDIFYSDAKMCLYRFNLLVPGTEVIFTSRQTYTDTRYLNRIFFHDDIPEEERIITFTVPEGINVEFVEKNFAGFNIVKTESAEGTRKVVRYTAKGLKAMKSERNSLGPLYDYPHIVVVTKDFAAKTGKTNVIASVNDLYKWYAGLVKDVNNDTGPLKAEVTRLTSGAKTPEDKIRAIYYWVQDNIKYIAFEDGLAGFKPEAAQNVYNNRYGDCKGMANLTKHMLKLAGFDARLTWIGTNRIPYGYDLPSLSVDNHMICTVTLGDKQYVLDTTEKYIALGMHGERIQGKQMLIENGDNFLIKTVPIGDAGQNTMLQSENLAVEGDHLKGQGALTINGESKKDILYMSTNIRQEDQHKLFDYLVVPHYTNADLVKVTNTPPIDREKAMEIKYTYDLTNKVTRFDDDIYVDVDWNKAFGNLKIDDERISDYYFNRKINTSVSKKLRLPDGYTVSHLPKGLNKSHADFSFVAGFEQRDAELVYTSQIIIKHGRIKKADFKEWNAAVKELNDFYDDQVVLSKKK
jgi:transglutaminase-like putative cysteine protease